MTAGTLYIIASPIGNLEDITLRALRILREEARFVYCEDTRQTRKLLQRYEIQLPSDSLHSHSPELKLKQAVDRLLDGISVAYLTDSGTPGISDPGSRLVRLARESGIRVIPVPGPSALAAAVSVSGFSGKNVIFAGFISKKPGRRKNELAALAKFPGSIVLYESPHRIQKLMADIAGIFPDAEVLIARELTKVHEDLIFGNASEIASAPERIKELGEFTVVINNRNGHADEEEE